MEAVSRSSSFFMYSRKVKNSLSIRKPPAITIDVAALYAAQKRLAFSCGKFIIKLYASLEVF